MKTTDLKKGIIIRNSKRMPEHIVNQAHEIYKERGHEYARFGGFTNKGPLRCADNEAWNKILFELAPGFFWEGEGR